MAIDDQIVRDRLHDQALLWRVRVVDVLETPTSLVGLGSRDTESVALKVVKREGDEWRSGEVLRAFDGRGIVRVLASEPGAVLMERLEPGRSLVDVVLRGEDERATEILADVASAMSPSDPPPGTPTVEDWGNAFHWYSSSGDERIPQSLSDDASVVYRGLCGSQSRRRLLHGDLQHSNVLFDSSRGWTAVDAKGVIGEPEYDLGAFVRNPAEAPSIFTDLVTVERRLHLACSRAGLDYDRALHWAFAQAVLSAIWSIQDDGSLPENAPVLVLAKALRPRLTQRGGN